MVHSAPRHSPLARYTDDMNILAKVFFFLFSYFFFFISYFRMKTTGLLFFTPIWEEMN